MTIITRLFSDYAVEAGGMLHRHAWGQDEQGRHVEWCETCTGWNTDRLPWPCPMVRRREGLAEMTREAAETGLYDRPEISCNDVQILHTASA